MAPTAPRLARVLLPLLAVGTLLLGHRALDGETPPRRVLTDSAGWCQPRTIWTRSVTNKQVQAQQPEATYETRPSCVHSLDPEQDIIVGVFHCLANEKSRLRWLKDTWGSRIEGQPQLKLQFLASHTVKGQTALSEDEMVWTDTGKWTDTYLSTTTKGSMGLVGMYEKFPDAKWFIVVGDDVVIDGLNLAHQLSAFDPDEEWCLGETGRVVDKSKWRLYGGAVIVTSRALTARLVPVLKRRQNEYKNTKPPVHDLFFTELMRENGGGLASITHVDGMYSMAPGAYMRCPGWNGFCPPTTPDRLPHKRMMRFPSGFHDMRVEDYFRFSHTAFQAARACQALGAPQAKDTVPAVVGVPNEAMVKRTTTKHWPALWGVRVAVKDLRLGGKKVLDLYGLLHKLLSEDSSNQPWLAFVPEKHYLHPQALRHVLAGLPDGLTARALICSAPCEAASGFIMSKALASAVVEGASERLRQTSQGLNLAKLVEHHGGEVHSSNELVLHTPVKSIGEKWPREVPKCPVIMSTDVIDRNLARKRGERRVRESPEHTMAVLFGHADLHDPLPATATLNQRRHKRS